MLKKIKNYSSSPSKISRFIPAVLIALFALIQPSYALHHHFVSVHVNADKEVGDITGKIMGALQPVNKVTVILLQNNKVVDKTETDENGIYKFRYLPEGTYDIKASKDGYRTYIVTDIPSVSDKTTRVDLYLAVVNNSHMPDDPIVETYHYLRSLKK